MIDSLAFIASLMMNPKALASVFHYFALVFDRGQQVIGQGCDQSPDWYCVTRKDRTSASMVGFSAVLL